MDEKLAVEDSKHDTEISSLEKEHGVDDEQKRLYATFASQSAEWHRQKRKQLLRKVDWHMLPFLGAIYLLSYLVSSHFYST